MITKSSARMDFAPIQLDILRRLVAGETITAAPPNGWCDSQGIRVIPGVMYRLFSSGFVEFGPKQTLRITKMGREVVEAGRL